MKTKKKPKKAVPSANKIFTLLVKTVGPTKEWPGRCFEIASRAVDAGVPGKALYGHWLGPVAKGTLFEGRDRVGFVRHGWIELPDGRIIDATRWCFEGASPYVYIGKNDHYDMGGNAFRRAVMRPPPAWSPDEKQIRFDGSTPAWNFVEKILNLESLYDDHDYKIGFITDEQMFWLANLDLQALGEHAKEVYAFIIRRGREALIPIDNRRHVEGLTV